MVVRFFESPAEEILVKSAQVLVRHVAAACLPLPVGGLLFFQRTSTALILKRRSSAALTSSGSKNVRCPPIL